MLKAGLVELNWTFVFQILNTFILYLLLKKFLFAPVTEVIEAREKSISDSLNDAERISNEAEKFKTEYYEKLQSAEEEGREIVSIATKNADDKSSRILKEAREAAEKQKEKAEADMALERKKVINEVKDEISSLAILAATKVLESEVDEDKNKILVNKFIEQVGDN